MKSFLIIGLGRFGLTMAKELQEQGNSVMGVDINEKRADDAAVFLRNVQIGDGTDERFIQSLGVSNFDVCVIAVGGEKFQTALEITVLLKDYGAVFVIARANMDVHEKLLLRNGADYVECSDREAAERLAVKYGENHVLDYLEITEDYGLYEISPPKSWLNKTVAQMNVRTKYNVNIIGTKKGKVIKPTITPDYIFTTSENIMIMGNEKDVQKLLK